MHVKCALADSTLLAALLWNSEAPSRTDNDDDEGEEGDEAVGEAQLDGARSAAAEDEPGMEFRGTTEANDGADGEDCALIMTRDGRQTRWDDRPCNNAYPYVCKASP